MMIRSWILVLGLLAALVAAGCGKSDITQASVKSCLTDLGYTEISTDPDDADFVVEGAAAGVIKAREPKDGGNNVQVGFEEDADDAESSWKKLEVWGLEKGTDGNVSGKIFWYGEGTKKADYAKIEKCFTGDGKADPDDVKAAERVEDTATEDATDAEDTEADAELALAEKEVDELEAELDAEEAKSDPDPNATRLADADPQARSLFASNCAACHTLADAGATGQVGPNLDKLSLSMDQVLMQIENGGGAMPPGLLSGDDAKAVAKYVAAAAGGAS